MSEHELKTPLLAAEIEAERQRRAEEAAINTAVPGLRRRLGSIIRGHMSLPSRIEGKRLVLEATQYANPGDDWIQTHPNNADNHILHDKLSPTLLHCSTTTSEGAAVTFVLSSSGYPFENQVGVDPDTRELRPVDFKVTTEELGYYFVLPQPSYGECGLRIRFREDGTEKGRPTTISHVRLLEEILDLIEAPTTKFSPQPFAILQTA